MRATYWETYFNPSYKGEKFSAGRLVLDVILPRKNVSTQDVMIKLDKTFQKYWKEICAAQIMSCKGREGVQTLYNLRAWGSAPVLKLRLEGNVLDNHKDIFQSIIWEVDARDCARIKLGFLGDWINPYVLDGRHFRWGTIFTIVRMKQTFLLRVEFSKSSMWFADWVKPLFENDQFVQKNPDFPWRKNEKGVISPDQKAVWENRWKLMRIAEDLITRIPTSMAILAYGRVKYDGENKTLLWSMPDSGSETGPLLGFWSKDPEMIKFEGRPAPKGFLRKNIKGNLWFLEPRHFRFLDKGYKALNIKDAIL